MLDAPDRCRYAMSKASETESRRDESEKMGGSAGSAGTAVRDGRDGRDKADNV